MGQKYLIDTNVISHLFASKIPEHGKEFVQEIVNSEFIISVSSKSKFYRILIFRIKCRLSKNSSVLLL